MQELNLDSQAKIKATFQGQSYEIKEPTLEQQTKFENAMKGVDESKSLDCTLDYLQELGLPKQVAVKVGLSKLKVLLTTLTGEFGKK